MFTITECPDHGTRAVADLASLAVYVGSAAACAEDVARDPSGHHMWHATEGTECWSCCSSVVLDPGGVLPALAGM